MNDGNFFDITENPEVVRVFQEMLRLISLAQGTLPLIAVDGIYGSGMEEAVRQYQAQKKFPVTGRVDSSTWESVASDSERILSETIEPSGIHPFPHLKGYRICMGECSDLVTILQLMLDTLSIIYDNFGHVPVTGTYDNRTSRAIRIFQGKNMMPEHDYVDKNTWDAIANQYDLQVNRSL